MPSPKLYRSKAWLERKLYVEHLGTEEIAKLAGTSKRTIERAITEFGLRFTK